MGLVSELRRRNVFRMVVLYAVAAWLIMQVAEVVVTLAALPTWSGQIVLALLAVGFPIALIFSWFYELTSEGISLEQDVPPGESITHVTGRRLDFLVISLLCAAVILFAYDKWWTGPPTDASIAVLPFVNMSDDASNEYFSDGLSEELLNLLAKVPELRVTSRSSAFAFKGQEIDISEIAQKLNVAHILEGSVRKSGNQVRITAQLIEARSDTHLWSETWDRALVDIFAIQDEIAAEVVTQLRVKMLGARPKASVTDPNAYAFYLQARFVSNQMTPANLQNAVELFQKALSIDSTYVPAWDGLAQALTNQANSGLRPGEGYGPARKAASKALEIDPTYSRSHGRLGWISLFEDGNLKAAARHYERALELDPTDMASLNGAATLLQMLGRLDKAIDFKTHIIARDPVFPAGHANLGIANLYAGRLEAASSSFRTTLTLSPDYIGAQCLLSMAMLLGGDARSALRVARLESFEPYRLICLGLAHHALGDAAKSDEALQQLIREHSKGWAYNIGYIFAYRGEADAAFLWLEKAVEYKDGGLADIAVQPFFANLHNDPRWYEFLERLGKTNTQLATIDFSFSLQEE